MRNFLRPRLSNIDVFASALAVALGVQLQGCGGTVVEGSAGDGGNGAAGPGSGGSSGGAGGGSAGGSGASGSGGSGSGLCVNPMPVTVNGQDTGIDSCAGGQYRRRAALECPTSFPDLDPCCGGCPAGQICNTGGEIACTCVDACTNDSQCGADQLCMCGETAGLCISAKCQTASDCGAGQECTSWDTSMGCLFLEFTCTTPQDTCGGDLDCANASPNAFCSVQADGHRACTPGGCAIGRPFLVDGEARTAPLARRADWCQGGLAPSLEGIDGSLRDDLAAAWEHIARMEHASIAAFARFSLQLLSLGAPADLIERTNSAMTDETRHARAAFALASAYRGRKIGPGALSPDGALDGGDVATIVRLVIREGCVGETVAAVEAGEAEANAGDPVVRSVLAMIANDESEHAELAWRTLRWALETLGDEVRSAVREEIALLENELYGASSAALSRRDEVLLSHGIVTNERREPMRREVLSRAALPCLRALVDEALALAA